jgi:hypothetical protein
MLRHKRKILRPLAQRRQPDRHDVETIIKILAKFFLLNRLLEILVDGREKTDIATDNFGATDALKLSFLQDAQQLRLKVQRQLADLIEKQRAAVGQLKASDPCERP